MAVTTTPAVSHRPAAAVSIIVILIFLGFTALAGGIELAFEPVAGGRPPQAWLDAIPLVDSWVIPGLVLASGFGAGSLITAYGVYRRPRWAWLRPLERLTGHHWAWLATLAIGAGHLVWIGLELAYLPEPSALQVIYGAVGLALVVLSLLPRVRAHLRNPVDEGKERS